LDDREAVDAKVVSDLKKSLRKRRWLAGEELY